jgi:hypothetical protein
VPANWELTWRATMMEAYFKAATINHIRPEPDLESAMDGRRFLSALQWLFPRLPHDGTPSPQSSMIE